MAKRIKQRGRVLITPDLVCQLLKLPPGHHLVAQGYDVAKRAFFLDVAGPDMPEMVDGQPTHLVIPIYERNDYRLVDIQVRQP